MGGVVYTTVKMDPPLGSRSLRGFLKLVLRRRKRACDESLLAESLLATIEKSSLGTHARRSVVLQEPERANHIAPSLTLIALRFHRSFPESFHSTSDTCAAARHNLVTAGVEDLKRNCIGELIAVVTNVDGAGESVCLYPDPGGTKNEDLGYCAIRVALGVPPDTQSGSGCRGELACGRVGERTPFGEGKQCREGPQHLSRLTVLDRELYAPCAFKTSLRIIPPRLSSSCQSRPQEKHAGKDPCCCSTGGYKAIQFL